MSTLTTDPWILFAVIFAAGFVIGFLLRPGGAKWRRKYEVEQAEHMTLRREFDLHMKRHVDAAPVERDTLRTGSF